MNSGLKSGLVLLILGIIAGVLLAVVNYYTEPYIIDNEEFAKSEALNAILVDDEGNVLYDLDDYVMEVYEDVDENINEIYTLKIGSSIELIVYQVSQMGYNGDVTMLIAVNSDYNVVGYQVITHGEDAGFGADIVDTDFGINTVMTIDRTVFDSISGATGTEDAIFNCFVSVSERAASDFGGALDE